MQRIKINLHQSSSWQVFPMRNNLVLPGRRLMQIDFDSLQSNAKGQFLFGWTPNPGTAFYVGYNDDINRRGFKSVHRTT